MTSLTRCINEVSASGLRQPPLKGETAIRLMVDRYTGFVSPAQLPRSDALKEPLALSVSSRCGLENVEL
jgi:hypothetical protein